MWGADIYGKPSLRGRLYRSIKRLVIPRLGAVSALVPGDFDDLQRLIGTCPNYVRAFYSPSYETNFNDAHSQTGLGGTGATRLILGNSGWEQNDHIPALRWLSRFADRGIQVICPLGYPKQSVYKSKVIEVGLQTPGRPIPSHRGPAFPGRIPRLAGLLRHPGAQLPKSTGSRQYLRHAPSRGENFYPRRFLHLFHVEGFRFSCLRHPGHSKPFLRGSDPPSRKNLPAATGHCSTNIFRLEASIEGWKMLLAKIGAHNNNGEKPHDHFPCRPIFRCR